MSSIGTFGQDGISPAGADYPPGPAAWAAGLQFPLRTTGDLNANDLNQQLSVPVAFLSRKPKVILQQQGIQTAIGTTATAIPMDAEISDAWGMHSVSGDLTKIVIPQGCDGIYLVTGKIPMGNASNSTTAQLYSMLLTNGSTSSGGAAEQVQATSVSPYGYETPCVADLYALSAGTYVQLGGQQGNGTSIATMQPNFTGVPGTQSYDLYPIAPSLSARWIAAMPGTITGGVYPAQFQALADPSGNPVNVSVPALTLGPTTPGTWALNAQIASAQLNSDIRQSVLFLANPPAFRLYQQNAGTSVPNASWTAVGNLTPTFDTWNGLGTSTMTWTCPLAGLYTLGGTIGTPGLTTAYSAGVSIQVTSGTTVSNWSGQQTFGLSSTSMTLRHVRLNAGDTVQLALYQTSGSAITTTFGSINTYMFGFWVSR